MATLTCYSTLAWLNLMGVYRHSGELILMQYWKLGVYHHSGKLILMQYWKLGVYHHSGNLILMQYWKLSGSVTLNTLWLYQYYTITLVLKVFTYVIWAHPTKLSATLVIMSVSTFTSDDILYLSSLSAIEIPQALGRCLEALTLEVGM